MAPSTNVTRCLACNDTAGYMPPNLTSNEYWEQSGTLGAGPAGPGIARKPPTRTVLSVATPVPTPPPLQAAPPGLLFQEQVQALHGPALTPAFYQVQAQPTPTVQRLVQAAAYPAPTPAPQLRRRTHQERGEHCQGEHCPVTDVVWVDKIKTVIEPKPPQANCHTVLKTQTFYETELHEWLTTVYPYVQTEWVYEPTPVLHTGVKTGYIETVHPATPTGQPYCGDGCDSSGGKHDGNDWDDWWHWHQPHLSLVPPLTGAQVVTLIFIPIFLVFDLFVWPIHLLALIFLFPFQLYTNLVHEIFHLSAGVLGGATICSVTIDPGCGPMSFMRNGSPMFTLLMGYIGSQIIGGFYVCLSFDEKASKITYLIHAPLWPAVFWFAVGVWPKIQVLIVVGTSIALWFIWQARFLRFYMLFIGLLSLYYVLWDVVDDFFFHKQNESDASILARIVPGVKAGVWAIIFIFTASGVLACAIIAGLHFFRGDIHQPSQHFLPT
ncbi:unnamed protein product [Parajaminaea phylloscopi]